MSSNLKRSLIEADPEMNFSYLTETSCWKKKKVSELTAEELHKFENHYHCDRLETVVLVKNGKIYVGPYARDEHWSLSHSSAKDAYIVVSLPDDLKLVESWLKKYDALLYQRDYLEKERVKTALRQRRLNKELDLISDELLSHCIKIPDYGVKVDKFESATRLVNTHLTHAGLDSSEDDEHLIVRPYSSFFRKPIIEDGDIPLETEEDLVSEFGTFGFENGIVVFPYIDGNTYVSPDFAVAEALHEGWYALDTREICYVPFAHSEKILDEDFDREWRRLKMLYAPEKHYNFRGPNREADHLYPRRSFD